VYPRGKGRGEGIFKAVLQGYLHGGRDILSLFDFIENQVFGKLAAPAAESALHLFTPLV
jgi:hypothetical protein